MALYACMVLDVDDDWQIIDAMNAEDAAELAVNESLQEPGVYSVEVRAFASPVILKVGLKREVKVVG